MKTARADLRRSIGWVAIVLGAIILLRLAASGSLAAPPLTSLDALADWSDARDPATSAVALVRLVAEFAAWYVLALTLLYGVATALRSGGMTALADALAVPGAQRLVRSGLGVGLLATTAAGLAGDEGSTAAPSTEMMQPDPAGSGTAWMTPESPTPTSTDRPADDTPTPVVTEPATPATWTVSSGESFWTIAEEVLTETLGREPDDTEIDPYWRAVIDANRDRLVDETDPDVIHPGQTFELPDPTLADR